MAKPKYTTTEDEITFNLLDTHTVDRLVKNGDVTLPRKKVDVPKDQQWNTKQMSSKLLQGILNGSSIPEIAQSLMDVIGNNVVSAIRNARTMVTGAENAGRLDSYENLAEQGVIQRKVWLATHDERVRESHAEIDGEEAEIDKAFSNGLMYPGDPSGDPSEVWNCRCSMKDHIVGFRRADGSISYIEGEGPVTPAPATQEEAQPVEKERVESEKLKGAMSSDDYERFIDLVSDADNSELYREHADDIRILKQAKNGGQYVNQVQSIEFSYSKDEGVSRYSTVAHEYNHFFDYTIGRGEGLHFTEVDLVNERCQIGSGTVKPVQELASASDEFLSALRADMDALKDKGLEECYDEFKGSMAFFNSTGGVQDALDGFFGTQADFYGWGHGDRYYNGVYSRLIQSFNHQTDLKDAYNELGLNITSQAQAKMIFRQYKAASEAWANVGSAVTCGGAELEAIEKYMPNTLEAYKQIIGGLKHE